MAKGVAGVVVGVWGMNPLRLASLAASPFCVSKRGRVVGEDRME